MTRETTIHKRLGGDDGIRAIVGAWYPTVLSDPKLQPLFGDGHPDHIDHLTAFLSEVFGGQPRYTNDLGGFPALLEAHRGLAIEEDQRRRFIALFLASQALLFLEIRALDLALWSLFCMTGQVAILAYPWLASLAG